MKTKGMSGKTHSLKSKLKMSVSQKIAQKGKTHSQKTKDKMSAAHLGKTHSQKSKDKMSVGHRNRSFETREKMRKNNLGKKHPHNQETKNKISKAHLGKTQGKSNAWKGGSDKSRARTEEHRRGYGFIRIGLKISGCTDHHLTKELITSVAPLIHIKCHHNEPTMKMEGVIG